MYFVTGQEIDEAYTDSRLYNLGDRARDAQGNEFVFILFNQGDGADAGTAGKILVALDTGSGEPFEGTCDPNSSTIAAIAQLVYGQLQATLTEAQRGWAQYKGRNRIALVASGTINQGSRLSVSATVSGAVIAKAANTVADIGCALEAAAASAIGIGQAHLQIPL